ncbi:MAG: DNA repair protein RecO [bacterium]|nr:DNA repair protein RecO [bacterium]
MIVTTDAIVLHSRRFGDTSRIVVVYAELLGKISVVAKGVRKPTSPLGSALEPLSHSRITVYHNKNRELHVVSAAEQLVRRHRLLTSYEHMSAAMLVTECVMRTQADNQPDANVFEMLSKGLAALEAAKGADGAYGEAVGVRLMLAELMGFGLPYAEASVEGAPVSVSPEDGIPRNGNAPGIRMSGGAYAMIHAHGLRLEHRIVATEALRAEIESFITLYFSHHLDRRIVSRSFDVLR